MRPAAQGGMTWVGSMASMAFIALMALSAVMASKTSVVQAAMPLQSPLPAASWPDLDGKPVSLAGLRGKPVLVNVWATWCKPCLHELTALIALDRAHRAAGLQVVGIAIDLDLGPVEAAVAKHGIGYRVLHDAEGTSSRPFALDAVPASFLFDGEGRLVWQTTQALRADDPTFVAALRQVLGGKAGMP